MYVTAAKRKLVPRHQLEHISDLVDLGVPLTRALRDTELDACRPVVARLIDAFKLAYRPDMKMSMATRIKNSLFPPWLKEEPAVQESPDGWRYAGRFPLGEWLEPIDNEDNSTVY